MASTPSYTRSPSLRALGESLHKASNDSRNPQNKGLPLLHNVNTTLPQHVTVTPASARSLSSTAPSPYLNSLQSSPDCLEGHDLSSQSQSPVPLDLPESAMTHDHCAKFTGPRETYTSSKGPGLIRKLSHSARTGVQSTGQRLRRKASSSAHDKREHSAGPITRRRSDSKTSTPTGATMTDLSPLDMDETRSIDSMGFPGAMDGLNITSEPAIVPSANLEGAAPTIPDMLIRGCGMTKVTRNRRKRLTFYVAVDGSKVFWNPPKPSKRFCVDDIRDIRSGDDTRHYRQELHATPDESERWFTILYIDQARSKQEKTMHLIADRKEDVSSWIDSLEALSRHRIDLMTGLTGSLEREHVIRAHWDRETARRSTSVLGRDEHDSLDYKAIENLAESLHIHCSKAILQKQFGLADARQCGRLNYQEFKDFVRRLKERNDLKVVFAELTKDTGFAMTREIFFSFLRNKQGIDVNRDIARWTGEYSHWVRIASSKPGNQLAQLSAATSDLMAFDAFSSFMVSPSCGIYAGPKSEPIFDRPMNEYFISSSHNTYLTGRQFAGESSTEAYISALRKGCRCVEIDCWNGSDGKPIVTHGHTRTKHVLFSDCISVISRYAFDASPYPVILSLEVHCDADQQAKMVQIMKDGFGEKLVLATIHESNTHQVLPTPEELKYRILVKVKSSGSVPDGQFSPERTEPGRRRSTSSPYAAPTPITDCPSILNLPALSNPPSTSPPGQPPGALWSPSQRSMTATSASSAGEESDSLLTHSPRRGVRKAKKATRQITRTLADLGVYFQGYKYRSLNEPESREYNHIFSLDESKAGRLCRDSLSKMHFEDHNMRHMFRVYPKHMRVDSSNFDPNTFWRRGVQMVALNWQTYDSSMQVHQAMFAAGHDRHGYVLKPEYLRPADLGRFSPQDLVNRYRDAKHLVSFSVKMISAQQLPRLRTMASDKSINPVIEIQMFTAEDRDQGIVIGRDDGGFPIYKKLGIGSSFSQHTKVIFDNGYNPTFDDTIDLKLETRHPDLVFVRWTVWHSANGKVNSSNCRRLAVFTAKLSSLQQGYRHLPLYNWNGEEFVFSSLFCKIKKAKPTILPAESPRLYRRESKGILRTMMGSFTRTLSSDRESTRRVDASE